MSDQRIHFVASSVESAESAMTAMIARYGQHDAADADVIVALGGDGFMLRTLHQVIERDTPVFGMKMGNVGFLMNRFSDDDLLERLAHARTVSLNPLRMDATTGSGEKVTALAVNEISLLRQTNQAAHIRIMVNGMVKLEKMVCDGVLLATAAGSTAYNFSVRGPILPLGTDALALTPISPFRPRRWNGAILPGSASVEFEILSPNKRAVSATADAHEVRNVVRVEAYEDKHTELSLMFDPDHSLEERILNEQFL